MEKNVTPVKTVKAVPTSPIYAQFDLIEVDGKQVIVGALGFRDQFGMERMAKTAGEKGINNIGQHIVAIFSGQIDVIEPDEETKAKLAAESIAETKQAVVEGEIKPEGEVK